MSATADDDVIGMAPLGAKQYLLGRVADDDFKGCLWIAFAQSGLQRLQQTRAVALPLLDQLLGLDLGSELRGARNRENVELCSVAAREIDGEIAASIAASEPS